ncbi:MAG: tetratricopeptide repeat protein [bacterium]
MICQSKNPIHNKKALWYSILLLSAVTIAVYSVGLFNGFAWDDEFIIVKNPATRQITSVAKLFLDPDVVKPYYRPLSRATYLFDYRLFGMNPSAFHSVNIVIHLLNVILLYLVCSRVATNKISALVAALLFAIHPINTESVNFISARNNLLSLFFSLVSFLILLRNEGKAGRWPILSAIFFFFGLLCKETAMMMLIVIALYSIPPLSSGFAARLREKVPSLLPFVFLAGVYLLLRSLALHGVIGTGSLAEGLLERLARNYYIIPHYLKLFLFPADLTIFHVVPKAGLFNDPMLLLAWVAIAAAIWLIVRWRNRATIFGLLWFVVNYVPIANIVLIPSWPMADRFMYIPAAGLCLVAGEFLGYIYSRYSAKQLVSVGMSIIVITLAAWTVKRTMEWKDNISLFKSALKNDPASTVGHFNLGNAYLERNDLAAAKFQWLKALDIDPGYSDALTQMGTLAATQGDFDKAEKYYLAALHSAPGINDPDKAMAHYNLGRICEKERRPFEALQHYNLFLEKVSVFYAEYKPDAEERAARLRRDLTNSTGQPTTP